MVPWTGFNNTVLTGGLVVGLILMAPVYVIGKKFGVYYNGALKEKVMNSKFIKGLKASWLLDWYFKVN